MINQLMTLDEVNELINKKHTLVLAADEALLAQLNQGNWIGGTIPYFMDIKGGCSTSEQIFVTDFTNKIKNAKVGAYSTTEIQNLLDDRYTDGFTYILMPGFSEIHSQYALQANDFNSLFDIPTMGWITGVDLSDVGKVTPKVYNGSTGEFLENHIVALHCQLPEGQYANIDIINLFEQGDGDTITFSKDGFDTKTCHINGKETSFSDYVTSNNIDTRLPLVADYSGAMINTSIQNVNEEEDSVLFYAPVLDGHDYKFAKSVDNYVEAFNSIIPENTANVTASCNCILNYVYSELEGQKTADLTGPITFGEIAYVLVNQTMVLLTIDTL